MSCCPVKPDGATPVELVELVSWPVKPAGEMEVVAPVKPAGGGAVVPVNPAGEEAEEEGRGTGLSPVGGGVSGVGLTPGGGGGRGFSPRGRGGCWPSWDMGSQGRRGRGEAAGGGRWWGRRTRRRRVDWVFFCGWRKSNIYFICAEKLNLVSNAMSRNVQSIYKVRA